MKDLTQLRIEIDEIDSELIQLLAKRIKVVQEVGEYKKENNLPIIDPQREQKIIDNKIEQAKEFNLRPEFIQKLWQTLFNEAYENEK